MDVQACTQRSVKKLRRTDKKVMQDEEHKTVVFRLPLDFQGCVKAALKIFTSLEGVTHVSVDKTKNLVTVTGIMDSTALAKSIRKKLGRSVEVRNCDDDGGEGDGDNNGGVGEKNKKKGIMDIQARTQRLVKKLWRTDKKVLQIKENTKLTKNTEVTKFVLSLSLDCQRCVLKASQKIFPTLEGLTHVSVDKTKNLVTVSYTMDRTALAKSIRKKLGRSVEVRNRDDDGGEGDGDNNGGVGEKNKKKGSGEDNASNGDVGDKAEGGGGGGKMEAGFTLDYLGEGEVDYNFGLHAGFENGHPVGQLHVAHMVNGENLNGQESNEVGNGNGDGTGSDNDNNGGGGGDDNTKRGDRGNGWIRKTKDKKITYMGQLGFGDGGGQLLKARMFCRGSLNACSAIRSVVLV